MNLKNKQKNRKLAMIFFGVVVGVGVVIVFLLNYHPSQNFKSKSEDMIYDFKKLPLPMIINENDVFEQNEKKKEKTVDVNIGSITKQFSSDFRSKNKDKLE